MYVHPHTLWNEYVWAPSNPLKCIWTLMEINEVFCVHHNYPFPLSPFQGRCLTRLRTLFTCLLSFSGLPGTLKPTGAWENLWPPISPPKRHSMCPRITPLSSTFPMTGMPTAVHPVSAESAHGMTAEWPCIWCARISSVVVVIVIVFQSEVIDFMSLWCSMV